MFRQLAKLQKLQWKRHASLSGSVKAGKWMSSIFALFVIGYMLMFGFMLSMVLRDSQEMNVLDILNFTCLFFPCIDIIIKFFFKKINSITIIHYYRLPIKLNTLIDFVLCKEFLSVWNCYFLFFLLPIVVRDLIPACGVLPSLSLFLIFWGISLCASMVVRAFQVLRSDKPFLGYLLPVIAVGAAALMIWLGAKEMHPVTFMLDYPVPVLIFIVALFCALWILNRGMIRRSIYLYLCGEMAQRRGMWPRSAYSH